MDHRCDADAGTRGADGSIYYETVAQIEDREMTTVLKAFTTERATAAMMDRREMRHLAAVAYMDRKLRKSGLGDIYVKGGLALHAVLGDELAAIDGGVAIEDLAKRFAKPSDLDTGVYLPSLQRALGARAGSAAEQSARRDVVTAARVCRDALDNMRAAWTHAEDVADDIAARCEADAAADPDLLARLGAVEVEFRATRMLDRTTTRGVDAECAAAGVGARCVRVRTVGVGHTILLSDNSSLDFGKGESDRATFHLVRAKWSISATVRFADGGACEVACPAELVDVAIQRPGDSRVAIDGDRGMHALIGARKLNGVNVPCATLRYLELDLRQLMAECASAMRGSAAWRRALAAGGPADEQDASALRCELLVVEPKLEKRMARYAIVRAVQARNRGWTVRRAPETLVDLMMFPPSMSGDPIVRFARLVEAVWEDDPAADDQWMYDVVDALQSVVRSHL